MTTTDDARQLAELLKQLRTDSGLSTRELAKLTHMSQTKIARIESGKRIPTPPDVDAITRALEVDPDVAVAARDLVTQASPAYRSLRSSSMIGWKHEQQDLRAIERSSAHIRFFLPAMLTGLLQTPEYAMASVTGVVPTGSAPEPIVRDKIARQDILNTTTEFTFLLMPAAVTLKFLESDGMRGQWGRLLEVSRLPNVTLRVVSESALIAEGPMNTFTLYDDRIVTAELFSGMVTLAHFEDIAYYRALFDYFLTVSRSEEETRELLKGMIGPNRALTHPPPSGAAR